MSYEKRLLALKGLRFVHKQALRNWLTKHNKKGVTYTVRQRTSWIDEYGFTHLGEREYGQPTKIAFNGELKDFKNTLPFLTFKKMNEIFVLAGLAPIDFNRLSERHIGWDRLIDFFNDTYERRFDIYAKVKK